MTTIDHSPADLQAAVPDVEIYPGTEIMEDYFGDLGHEISRRNHEIALLVPQPSHNADDPLNWSLKWKWTAVVIQAMFIATSVISALSVSPLLEVYEAEWDKDATQISLLTGVLVIVTGYTNIILVPLVEIYGRRFVLIMCSLFAFTASIWHGAAKSYGSFMGAHVLLAVGMSIGESMMPIVVADMFFLYERGRFVSVYFFCLFNSMSLGPLIAGACAQHLSSWRDFYWIISSLSGVSFLSIIFFMPETKYHRTLADTVLDEVSPAGSAIDKTAVEQIEAKDDVKAETEPEILLTHLMLGKGKPSKYQFKIIQPADNESFKTMSRHFITPIKLCSYPIVIFGAWMLAFSAQGLLSVNYVQALALGAEPYNFDEGEIGLSNLAMVIGGTVGMATAGPFSDWVAMRQTRRNKGVREPEMRLISMLPFILICTVSIVVIGIGFDHGWPWQAIIIIGFGGIGLLNVSLSTIGITYAVDSYKPVAGQIMTVATVLKNTMGFGSGYFITDWVTSSGYTPLFMFSLGMIIGPALFGMIFFMFFGKRLRKLTRNSEVHGFGS
ncbi:MFS general substrate transporter [Limtongia smithiae]|uniref:MFS general substrate transporter n=1 Tax=Limtongia smithiae TaxID=1125753 RepID=UPI0034CFB574